MNVKTSGSVEIDLRNGIKIGLTQPCFIIAEIGQNHQGDVEIAKQMIKKAKECGANCVKFQKSCLKEKFNYKALQKPYNSVHSWGATYGEHKEYLEFSEETYKLLQRFAERDVGIMFSASAMDVKSIDFLHSLDVPFIKIGSGDSNNIPLIKYAASKQAPLIVSTGMLKSIDQIDVICSSIQEYHSKFGILHCVSSYPTPYNHVNIEMLRTLMSRYPNIPIGYSGHEEGVHICHAAVALGAKIIEKHFTLDKFMKGTDHKCSLTPSEFQFLVQGIRDIEMSMGSPTKRMQPSEQVCYNKLGKSLVAKCNVKKGTALNDEHLNVKVAEPKGICGSQRESVIGKTVLRDINEDESILESDVTM